MEELMNIQQRDKNRYRRAERYVVPAEASGLKKAAGGEDIVILTDEAINCFKRDNSAKNREEELRKLALRHINDYSPELENPGDDPEFMKAEKLVLPAEPVTRRSIP